MSHPVARKIASLLSVTQARGASANEAVIAARKVAELLDGHADAIVGQIGVDFVPLDLAPGARFVGIAIETLTHTKYWRAGDAAFFLGAAADVAAACALMRVMTRTLQQAWVDYVSSLRPSRKRWSDAARAERRDAFEVAMAITLSDRVTALAAERTVAAIEAGLEPDIAVKLAAVERAFEQRGPRVRTTTGVDLPDIDEAIAGQRAAGDWQIRLVA